MFQYANVKLPQAKAIAVKFSRCIHHPQIVCFNCASKLWFAQRDSTEKTRCANALVTGRKGSEHLIEKTRYSAPNPCVKAQHWRNSSVSVKFSSNGSSCRVFSSNGAICRVSSSNGTICRFARLMGPSVDCSHLMGPSIEFSHLMGPSVRLSHVIGPSVEFSH